MKTVIFDLDGTLADTLESIAFCSNKALAVCGYPPIEKEAFKMLVGDGADELIKRALQKVGDSQGKDYQTVREAYREIFAKDCMYEVRPYEGIVEVLNQLKANEVCLTVLSNKPDAEARQVIAELFGDELFTLVVGQREGVAKKPDPQGVYDIMKELGVDSKDTFYVGDTSTDMKTGKAAGLFTIGVLWGFRERSELVEHQADAVIEKPQELTTYICK